MAFIASCVTHPVTVLTDVTFIFIVLSGVVQSSGENIHYTQTATSVHSALHYQLPTEWLHASTVHPVDGANPSMYCDWGSSHIFTGCYHHISMKYETCGLCLCIFDVLGYWNTCVP